MTVSKVLRSAVIALALVPAVAQAANRAAPIAPVARISPAAQSLSLTNSVRAGARTGKKSNVFGLALLPALLIGTAIVAGVAVAASSNSNDNPASP